MDKVLIIGASSDLSSEVLPTLIDQGSKIGLHYSSNKKAVEKYEDRENVKLIQCTIHDEEGCKAIIDDYVSWAGGIDGIVIFLGDISATCHWKEIEAQQLENEYRYNAVYPLLLAKYAQKYMNKKVKGGGQNFVYQHSFGKKRWWKHDNRVWHGESGAGVWNEKARKGFSSGGDISQCYSAGVF